MKRLLSYGLALLAAGILVLSSCKDDLSMDTGLSDRISFAVENTTGGDESYVRSGFYYSYPPESVMELQPLVSEDADSLLLSVTESSEFVSNDRWTAGTSVTTRGSLASLSSSTQFGVSASVYPSSGSYSSYGLGNYFHDKKCTPNTALEYYWPSQSNKISFYAYYPYGNSYFTISSDATAKGYPVYSYSVPSDIAQQVDVMTASVVDNACSIPHSPVTLQFKHNCASVRFKFNNTGADPITIRSISLEGLKYSGTLHNGTWTLNNSLNSSSVNPFSLTLNTAVSAGATADLTGTGNIFIMLPQTLSGSSVLKIVTAEKTYSTVLSGEWVAGKTYTYTVKMDESWSYYLDVSGTTDFAYSGGTNNYTVKSYKQSVGGTQQAVAWTASFSTDGGSTWSSIAPSWLTAFSSSGSGGTSASSYMATVAAQIATTTETSATSILRSMPAVSDYDLSLHTVSGASCSMTTANCYLVHAAGTYKLPLVYGNAIKDGATNTTAYAPSGSSNSKTFLTPFLNHADAGITDPWLKKNSAKPNGAKLIWQDVIGLITNVGISGDYLTFTTASQSNIAEGNAVIAATKDGVVVWSWHIWVTNETLSTLTPIQGNSITYNVTPVNLGWVNIGNITCTGYEARSCTVKISQSGGQEKTFVVTQNQSSKKVTASKQGVNTYYQWGRKDPEIPTGGINSTTDHTAYNISGGSVSPIYSGTSVAIGTTIQNPLTHYCNSSNLGPYSTSQYNLWDANNTNTEFNTNKTIKTIYDPCPAGFCIPTTDLWLVMGELPDSSNYDGTWDSTNFGHLWTDGTTYFPASGCRGFDSGSINTVGSYGYYWSSSVGSKDGSYILGLSPNEFTMFYSQRGSGLSVRAVLED